MRYCHTLIPTKTDFTPSADQVRDFLSSMVARGAIGGEPSFVLRTPSSRFREGRNPFTGKTVAFRMTDRKRFHDIAAVIKAIATLKDYEAEVSGTGRPKTPPIPLDFDDPYYIGITCRVSSVLRSTSDMHEESGTDPDLSFYGTPCDRVLKTGVFNNPHTLEVIEVAGAGCARFWVEFEFGKSLFPSFDQADLQFLNPVIVAEAERQFGVRFVQGCNWG